MFLWKVNSEIWFSYRNDDLRKLKKNLGFCLHLMRSAKTFPSNKNNENNIYIYIYIYIYTYIYIYIYIYVYIYIYI